MRDFLSWLAIAAMGCSMCAAAGAQWAAFLTGLRTKSPLTYVWATSATLSLAMALLYLAEVVSLDTSTAVLLIRIVAFPWVLLVGVAAPLIERHRNRRMSSLAEKLMDRMREDG